MLEDSLDSVAGETDSEGEEQAQSLIKLERHVDRLLTSEATPRRCKSICRTGMPK